MLLVILLEIILSELVSNITSNAINIFERKTSQKEAVNIEWRYEWY